MAVATKEIPFKIIGKVTERFEDGTVEMFGTIECEGMARDNMYVRFDPQNKLPFYIYANHQDYLLLSKRT